MKKNLSLKKHSSPSRRIKNSHNKNNPSLWGIVLVFLVVGFAIFFYTMDKKSHNEKKHLAIKPSQEIEKNAKQEVKSEENTAKSEKQEKAASGQEKLAIPKQEKPLGREKFKITIKEGVKEKEGSKVIIEEKNENKEEIAENKEEIAENKEEIAENKEEIAENKEAKEEITQKKEALSTKKEAISAKKEATHKKQESKSDPKQEPKLDPGELQRVYSLSKQLRHPNLKNRLEAIQNIASSKSNIAFDLLKKEWPSMNNIKLREEYIKILGIWDGEKKEEAKKILVHSMFQDPSNTVQEMAILAFAQILKSDETKNQEKFQSGVKILLQELAAKDSKRRKTAIDALIILGKKENIPYIATCLASSYQSVRREAVIAFEKLQATEHVDILIKHYSKETYLIVLDPLLKAVFSLDKEKAFPLMLQALSEKKQLNEIRRIAGEFLAQYATDEKKQKKTIQYLTHYYFNEKDQDLRTVIINSLSHYDRDNAAIQGVLRAAMEDDSRKVREAAKEAFGKK
ncbi:MAG: hypothetical protein HUU50_22710 [Candidatus Brocadiae bacterium]|nr:hypothetical protein [Candidatus Brocadiia bacterium]